MTPDETPAPDDIVADQPESTEAPMPETAGTSAPEFLSENFDPSTLDEPLQQAYKQMQGAFTKKTQTLAEERKQLQSAAEAWQKLQTDESTQLEILRQLAEAQGYALPEEDTGEVDPTQQMMQEWEQFKAAQETEKQNAQLEQLEQSIFSSIDELAPGLDPDTRDLIFDHTIASPPNAEGNPNVQGALDKLRKAEQAMYERVLKSKNAPQVSKTGTSATQQFDLSTPEGRANHMAALIDAGRKE